MFVHSFVAEDLDALHELYEFPSKSHICASHASVSFFRLLHYRAKFCDFSDYVPVNSFVLAGMDC